MFSITLVFQKVTLEHFLISDSDLLKVHQQVFLDKIVVTNFVGRVLPYKFPVLLFVLLVNFFLMIDLIQGLEPMPVLPKLFHHLL